MHQNMQQVLTLLLFLSLSDRLDPFLYLLVRRVKSCLYFHQTLMASSTETGEETAGRKSGDPFKALCFLSEGEQNRQFKMRCIACAVDVNAVFYLLTSSSAIKEEDKKKNLIFTRFSRKNFGRYTVHASFRKEIGEFAFLKITDTPKDIGGSWSIDPLNLKLPSSKNLKALTSPCATEKFKFKFKCDGESGTIKLIKAKRIEETSIVGAPIIIKKSRKFSVIGVVGLINDKQLFPYYLDENVTRGEFCFVCAHLHLVVQTNIF